LAFSSISMSPMETPVEGPATAGVDSALLVVPVFELTWIVTVRGRS